MEKSKEKSFVGNIIIIFSAQLLIKILGMAYRMVITNIKGFGDSGNGFYSAGFQIYTLLLAISSVGIPNAVSKLISQRRAVSDFDGADKIFKVALYIFGSLGLILSLLLFAFSVPISKYILNMNGAEYTMAALSPSVFFVCIASVLRGYFSGTNRMRIMSSSQILEQIVKSVLTIVFVFSASGYLPEIMSGWANFATTVATVISTVYLLCLYKKTHIKQNNKFDIKKDFAATVKTILMIAVPISLCSVISAVNRIIDTATITRGIEKAFAYAIPAHGIYGTVHYVKEIINPNIAQLGSEAVRLSGMLSKSDTLLNLPLALNIAFATVLVPTISKYDAIGNNDKKNSYINISMLVSVALVLPCAVGLAVLAKPIYNIIYPNAALGYELLQLGAISLVFTALNQTITGALQGLGKVHIPVIALTVGCVIKIVLNCILIRIPSVNIYGAVIGSIVCQVVVFLIDIVCLCEVTSTHFSVKKMFVKPFICSVIMCITSYYSYKMFYQITLSNIKSVIVSIGTSIIIYAVLIMTLKVFERQDLLKIPILKDYIIRFDKTHIRNE